MPVRFHARVLTHGRPLSCDRSYLLKHTAGQTRATIADPDGDSAVIVADTMPEGAAFLLFDTATNELAAAAMAVNGDSPAAAGLTVWFTGLSSAGKSTIADAVYASLTDSGAPTTLLDGDAVRRCWNDDLGFSKEHRDENIRRIGLAAALLTQNGRIAIVAAISPYDAVRQEVRAMVGNFVEVYVTAPLAVLEERDRKGLYRRCRAGEVHGVTGLDDPYEPPAAPELICRTDLETVAESVGHVMRVVESRLPQPRR